MTTGLSTIDLRKAGDSLETNQYRDTRNLPGGGIMPGRFRTVPLVKVLMQAQTTHVRTARSLTLTSEIIHMKSFTICSLLMLCFVCFWTVASAQKKKILVDVAHGQKFYSDPADKVSTQLVPTERLEYMTGELAKNASAHNAQIAYLKTTITPESLAKCDLLFIHVPSTKYSSDECKAIRQFVEKGGSLFTVVEEDNWATLDQVNVNDIVTPFGITYASNSADKSTGGHSASGKVTKTKYSIPFHGARKVEGGTPFAYSNESDESPFGVFTEVKGGGKVIAMGDGMVSLYMTSWQGVTDYQCAGFMGETIGWLLK
jgi:hypothetical protein